MGPCEFCDCGKETGKIKPMLTACPCPCHWFGPKEVHEQQEKLLQAVAHFFGARLREILK